MLPNGSLIMRKTRPEDFDPKYKRSKMTGPKPEEVNLEGIVPIKAKRPSTDSKKNSDVDPQNRADSKRTTVRPNDRTVERERITKRHAFEIYRDQYEALKKLKATAMLDGNNTSMSEMVREAIDTFLKKHSE